MPLDPDLKNYRSNKDKRDQYAAMFFAALIAKQDIPPLNYLHSPKIVKEDLQTCFKVANQLLELSVEEEEKALMDWMQKERKHLRGY